MQRLRNLDIDLLRTFCAIAETGSFTRASERMLRNQSTISLQVKRLEHALHRKLLDRTSRSVRLTAEGEMLLQHARHLLALNDEIVARVNEPDLHGTVKLGTPEDFATTHLSEVLARFAQTHPHVSLEVTCDLTLNLMERFRAGAFDLVLVKREPAKRAGGVRVWREPLVWVAAEVAPRPTRDQVLPLVVSPEPCVYRKRATQALRRMGWRWRIAYTEEEFCQMLEGVSVMTDTAGQAVTLRAGDSCVVPRGFAGTWEVVETTTKRFVIYEAAAGALAMVLPAWAGNTFERNGLALRGHDPVAYFTDGQPMLGSKAFSAVHAGATYVFTSAAHRDRFVAQPERYLPQFGGFCAFGVAGGYKAAIDPAAFSIVEGKLYLNYSPKVQERWRADMSGFIQRAERQWPQVEKTEKVFE